AELAANSVELRRRALRRLGELMGALREADKLAKGTLRRGGTKPPRGPEPTLDQQGVDKDLAKAARQAAATPEDKYERDTMKAREIAAAHALNNAAVIKQARAERHEAKRAQRHERERNLATKLLALPSKKYAVIVADPEWRFEVWSDKGLSN